MKEMGILGSDASNLQVLDFSIRLSAILLCAASIGISVTMKQDNSTYGNLDFHNLIGLKYMVCISAVSAGWALVAALSSWFRFLQAKPWLFFLIDQVMAYLMMTTIAAQGEFLYLADHGDREVSWSEACASYGKFCSRLKLGIAVHVIAVACYLVLAVISAYRLFRKFEPPLIPSKHPHQKDLDQF